MKVLVTGATSGLGRNAVEYLRNKGISVRATGRNEAMGKLLSKMGAEFIPADLTELVSSQAKVMLAGIDTLWHCSSFTSPWGTQQLSISLTSAPPVVWANGQWHGECAISSISLRHRSILIITIIVISRKISVHTASPTSLPAARRPARR
ncbi:unnamed protein product [Klebsiella pneumoniae subsp. rhinoscleromatis SB3432]|nr:unnamed protein product [Klebsiella pneumoniae subsp. rhinoscleromatis SB3432]